MLAKKQAALQTSMTVLVFVLVFVLGASVVWFFSSPDFRNSPSAAWPRAPAGPSVTAPVPVGAKGAISMDVGFAPIVSPALPAVVNISSSKLMRMPNNGPSFFFNDPFFRRFFGDLFREAPSVPPVQRERSLGSGVLVRPDGVILTNNHVIEGANEIRVVLADKREFLAKVTGTDPRSDIAVLKIDGTGLPTLPMGDSAQLQVGNFVLAIGDPFGIGETVTLGIVSATGRGHLDIEDYEDFIQTDASINPGNSGGALIDVHGNLVGINTAILSAMGGGNQGIGFAVPINMARYVLEEILHHGKVTRGYLGVGIQEVTAGIAKAFHTKSVAGALVSQVAPDSPAHKAGIQPGDVIVAVDGVAVPDANMLRLRLAQEPPNTLVHLRLFRDGRERDVAVRLGELPQRVAEGLPPAPASGVLAGLEVQDLTPQIAKELGVPQNTTGVVIQAALPGSTAAESGLRRGDIIEEIDRHPIHNSAEFARAAREAADSALVLVRRGDRAFFVLIQR
jgi:serine protease Do